MSQQEQRLTDCASKLSPKGLQQQLRRGKERVNRGGGEGAAALHKMEEREAKWEKMGQLAHATMGTASVNNPLKQVHYIVSFRPRMQEWS